MPASNLFFQTIDSKFDLNNWKIEPETTLNVDLDDNFHLNLNLTDKDVNQPLYWSAPSQFLGNKVTSYGSSIRYSLKISKTDDDTTLTSLIHPDVILIGRNMTIIHTSLRQPSPTSEQFDNSVDVLETMFTHLDSGIRVSRAQLMNVLSGLTSVQVRATYLPNQLNSVLIKFEMDDGVDQYLLDLTKSDAKNRPALSVERCACPQFYQGYSCEQCIDGYHKVKSNGPGAFNCVPCQCNGHADRCDQDSGVCLNCQDNTEGDNCERCKIGFYTIDYGNGHFRCEACPCPGPSSSNIFADNCLFNANTNKVYYCECREGYTGQYCERCSAGYYGDPTAPGGRCLPCQCNDNIDLNDFGSCDQRTGACLRCLNNTAGINCERCEDWHYGDAIEAKNCKPCECNECGSETCDMQTGECKCKNNVIGYDCASCSEDQFGFNMCNGCFNCECDPIGSKTTQCNEMSGQCDCKPGK
jgi:laminin, alpha 3/5